MNMVARSTPEGYTLGAGNQSSLVIGPLLRSAGYDPMKDLSLLGSTATTAYVIAINPGVPAKTINDLIKLARAKPGFLSYGTSGSDTISHIGTELILGATNTRILHVPYKGAGPYLTALVAGEIDTALVGLPAAGPFVSSGKLRLIANTGTRRSPAAPDLPTLGESGLKVDPVDGRYGLVGPDGMPRDLVVRINSTIGEAIRSPEVSKRLLNAGFEPLIDTPEEYVNAIRREIETFSRVIKQAGIKADG